MTTPIARMGGTTVIVRGTALVPSLRRLTRKKKRTLTVDLVDNSDKEMVWRGVAKDTLADSSDKNVKMFNKAMDKLFKNFPPTKK